MNADPANADPANADPANADPANAAALQAAIRAMGIDAEIRADGAVAVMRVVPDDAALGDAGQRRSLVALAARHGFRNIALEVAG